MNLEDIMLNEISPSEKEKHYDSTYMRYLKESKNIETESRTWLSVAGAGGNGELFNS